MSSVQDTIVALGTPTGTSAIAVVRVSGARVRQIVESLWQKLPDARQVMRGDYRRIDGALLDDVLYVYFAAPNSYSGEDTLEVSCHGNPFIAGSVLEDLCRRGCRMAEAGEFTKRAFLNGRIDLSQAEAVMDLIHARSERSLAMANRLLRGALSRRIEELTSRLLEILARIEAYIDFPEEDLPAEDRSAMAKAIEALHADLGRLVAGGHYGGMLREGIRTVLIGEPNAGKSSLLNRLLGRERALVSSEPGTTRDYIEETLSVGGHCLRLVDTAGLNLAAGGLEQQGVAKSLEQMAEADIYLWVIDISTPLPDLPTVVCARLTQENTIVVLNKVDLAEGRMPLGPSGFRTVAASAVTGAGMDVLLEEIGSVVGRFSASVGEDMVAINARHAVALGLASEGLENAARKIRDGEYSELAASDLRSALDAFGQIAGRIDNEQVLDRLFSTFCIGK